MRNNLHKKEDNGRVPVRLSPRFLAIVSIILSMSFSQPLSQAPLVVRTVTPEARFTNLDFYWNKSLIVNTSTNFIAIVSGGLPPYKYDWDFGDGQTVFTTTPSTPHNYVRPGNYTVSLTVTDSASPSNRQSVSKNAAANNWPATWNGWTVSWNITNNDGVNLWNVQWHGRLVIRDARLAGIGVRYKDNYCLFYDEFLDKFTDTIIFEYSPPGSPDAWMQIRSMSANRTFSLDEGYYYDQAWRFYASGRWDAEIEAENGGGCKADHNYETNLRLTLALGDNPNQVVSQYTLDQKWRNLVWEGSYADNLLRDTYHNESQWRICGGWSCYYLRPEISPTSKDFPIPSSRILLVTDKPNEIKTNPDQVGVLENPLIWVNYGELAYDRPLAIWFLGVAWVHGPLPYIDGAPGNLITLSFFPSGL